MSGVDNPERRIVHFDLDSFFVSVECLEHPELRGKPLIIGGDSDRGVVASCSYEARKYGVHSAMPSRTARKLCPQAIWLPGNMEKYVRYSGLVASIIENRAPVFERASIDEFYLDISGLDRFWGCLKWTQELRACIIKESGLPISFGLSSNKTVSKVATGQAKPNGEIEIPQGKEKAFLAPLPVKKIPMAGKKTCERLAAAGIVQVGALASSPVRLLENLLGKQGRILWLRANGIDDTPVAPRGSRESVSTETTFHEDILNTRFLSTRILKMVEKLAFELRRQNFLTGCLTLKLKYADFTTVTHQTSMAHTASDDILIGIARQLFEKYYNRKTPLRLLGIRLSHLITGNVQLSFFNDFNKNNDLYLALDQIRLKYGKNSVGRCGRSD